METQIKKAILLLKSLIFHFHGLDQEERNALTQAGEDLDAGEELDWALAFIAEDYMTAFERSKEFFSKEVFKATENERLAWLVDVWQACLKKGYLTEMETSALINFSKEWKVNKAFLAEIRREDA